MSHHGCEGVEREERDDGPRFQYRDYEGLRDGLRNLPMTWYPDLIATMVRAAYRKGVFKEGGASQFIHQREVDWGKGKRG